MDAGSGFWLFDREKQSTIDGLKAKFANKPDIANANIAALNAGNAYGETAELPSGIEIYKVAKADQQAGTYRNMDGTTALAWGLLAGGQLANLGILFASYPITPASNLLHTLGSQRF